MYRFRQLLIARSGLAMLAFMAISVALGGLLFSAVSQGDFDENMFRAYSLLNNVPGARGTENSAQWLQQCLV